MTSGFVDVNGARLFYDEAGAGNTVLFVHAGIADHRMWEAQVAPFAEKYRVIRFDMRGFGQSTLPAGPASLSDDIGGLLDAFGVARAALIGCSMGGSAALDLTLKQPHRVAALVLVGAGMSGYESQIDATEQAIVDQLEAADKAGDFEALSALELRLWVDGPNRTSEQVTPGVRDAVKAMNDANLRRGPEWEQVQRTQLDPPAAGRLGEVKAPTLVIVGGDDVSGVRETMDVAAQGIAGAQKVVMPGLTHVPNMERPAEFNKLTLDFLAPIW